MADVEIVKDGSVVEIRLHRPEKRNAVTNAMYTDIVDGLALLEEDDSLSVGLLSGEGADFCAGNDIGDFVSDTGPAGAAHLLGFLPKLTKPLVAAVQGKAIGIGATILLHCDLVYVASDLDLRFVFVDIGVVPEAGSTMLLPRLTGRVRAAEAMLLATPLDATTAVEWGIANASLDPALVRAAALASAQALAAKPQQALRATKALLRGDPADLEARIATEMAVFTELLAGPEFAAAASRFLGRH
ncbi:MAG: enoyl-CoA hydratase-related protein [Acidimicrobiales bacterium]